MARRRYHSLDGLRGLAALIVAFFHFLCAFVPSVIPEYSSSPWGWGDTPLALLYNGGFAVSVFFVLSGFVIAGSASGRAHFVLYELLKRYFRLTIPVVLSIAYAWLLLSLFPNSVHELRAIGGENKWLSYVYGSNLPPIFDIVIEGMFRVYINGWSSYNNVLWTMKAELIGSCLIYIIYSFRSFRLSVLFLLVLCFLFCLVLLEFEYACFAIGAIMQELWRRKCLPQRLPWIALGFGIFFGAMTEGYDLRVLGRVFPIEALRLGAAHQFWHMIAAAAVLYAVLNSLSLSKILKHRVLQFIGHISFGVYLVHVPLIYTLFASVYCSFSDRSMFFWSVFLISYLLVVGAVGYLFTLLVDQPAIGFVRSISNRFNGRRV